MLLREPKTVRVCLFVCLAITLACQLLLNLLSAKTPRWSSHELLGRELLCPSSVTCRFDTHAKMSESHVKMLLQNFFKEAGIYLLLTFFGFLVSPDTNISNAAATRSRVPFVYKVNRTERVNTLLMLLF